MGFVIVVSNGENILHIEIATYLHTTNMDKVGVCYESDENKRKKERKIRETKGSRKEENTSMRWQGNGPNMNELDSNEAVDRQVCNNKIATIAILRVDDGNQPRTKLIKDSEDFKYETPSCRVQKQILHWLPISLLVLHKM